MKTKIILTIFFISFILTKVFSFNPEPVLESNWQGQCKQYTDFFQAGYVILYYDMYNVDYNSYTQSISGKLKSTIKIDGITYTSICNITGTYNSSDFEVKINPGTIINEDALPYNLYWIYSSIRTTLYTDQENNNYYLLQGYTLDANGYNVSQIEFSNNPNY